MPPNYQVGLKVRKPLAEVFGAVHDPVQLGAYFATAGATGPMKEGATITWRFPEYTDPATHEPVPCLIQVERVVPNELIGLASLAPDGSVTTHLELSFKAAGPASTMVEIRESGWPSTPEGLAGSYDSCQGWTQMLCFLKAYLEHGIRLLDGIR